MDVIPTTDLNWHFSTLKPRHCGWEFPGDNLKSIFFNEDSEFQKKKPLKCVRLGLIDKNINIGLDDGLTSQEMHHAKRRTIMQMGEQWNFVFWETRIT